VEGRRSLSAGFLRLQPVDLAPGSVFLVDRHGELVGLPVADELLDERRGPCEPDLGPPSRPEGGRVGGRERGQEAGQGECAESLPGERPGSAQK
jgi:hypothetical protein